MVDFDQAKEYAFGDYKEIHKNLAMCFLNPNDFSALGLKEGLNLHIRGKYGEVVLYSQKKQEVPEHMLIIPVSIWANQITGIENDQLTYKNIEVEVEPTSTPVLTYSELISKFQRK